MRVMRLIRAAASVALVTVVASTGVGRAGDPSVPCQDVALAAPGLADYRLSVCQLPETRGGDYPTEFRVSRAGRPWVKYRNVVGATGGYDDADSIKLLHQGKRFLALAFGSDAQGTESVLAFDLKKKRPQVIRCPAFSCPTIRSLSESGTCKVVVECTQCVEADGTEKPTTTTRSLCRAR